MKDDEVRFSVFNAVRHPAESDACFMIEAAEAIVPSQSGLTESLEASLVQNAKKELSEEAKEYEPLGENTHTSVHSVERPP